MNEVNCRKKQALELKEKVRNRLRFSFFVGAAGRTLGARPRSGPA